MPENLCFKIYLSKQQQSFFGRFPAVRRLAASSPAGQAMHCNLFCGFAFRCRCRQIPEKRISVAILNANPIFTGNSLVLNA